MTGATRSRTGGEAIVDALAAHGVDTVFGLPGAQVYGLFDAFVHREKPLCVVNARHEQTCGYMAFGYAKATGRPAVFSVVPGPGMLNAAAARLTAYGCNTPVLLVTGQVPTADGALEGRERGGHGMSGIRHSSNIWKWRFPPCHWTALLGGERSRSVTFSPPPPWRPS